MIATLVALVIGLLVSLSKSTYDQACSGVTLSARSHLARSRARRYGPETKAIRKRMREGIASSVEQLWPTDPGLNPSVAAVEQISGMDDVHHLIMRLAPADEAHLILRSHALATCIGWPNRAG